MHGARRVCQSISRDVPVRHRDVEAGGATRAAAAIVELL
jgi:hypothetical protein